MIWTCPEGHSVLESPQRVCPWCEVERLRAEAARLSAVARHWRGEAMRLERGRRPVGGADGDGDGVSGACGEIERLRIGHERYETVRRMNAQQFKDAYILCISTGKPFDELIDELKPILRPA